MKWYYAEGGKQVGPVEESALDDLVRQGIVRDDTLVWKEGMAAWQRHAAVRGSTNPSPSPGSAAPPPASAAPGLSGDTRYCSECGRAVPASQLTSYGDVSVCTQCQPAYAQRIDPLVARLRSEPDRVERIRLRAQIQKGLQEIDAERFTLLVPGERR